MHPRGAFKQVNITMSKRTQEQDAEGTFSFAPIHYRSREGYRPLPEWALFFLELGKTLSSLEIENQRYTVALALPTRSYATALIGAGIACARIFLKSDDDSDHIETIYSLPEGTSLKYYDKGKVKKALKKDVMELRADSALVTHPMLKVPPVHGLHFMCDNRHSWIQQ